MKHIHRDLIAADDRNLPSRQCVAAYRETVDGHDSVIIHGVGPGAARLMAILGSAEVTGIIGGYHYFSDHSLLRRRRDG